MPLNPKYIIAILLSMACSLKSVIAIAYEDSNYRRISEGQLQKIEKYYGLNASDRIREWRDLLNRLANQIPVEDLSHIQAANTFFNQVEWKWDIDHWGQEDYWATPIETLATYAGDCEDFSIGKYFSLTSIGMGTEKLRITYVKALEYDLAHMVLAYYSEPSAEPLILDNINKTILPASQRTDLLPIYSFNGDGLWLAKSRVKPASKNVSENLPSWANLKRKIAKELQVN